MVHLFTNGEFVKEVKLPFGQTFMTMDKLTFQYKEFHPQGSIPNCMDEEDEFGGEDEPEADNSMDGEGKLVDDGKQLNDAMGGEGELGDVNGIINILMEGTVESFHTNLSLKGPFFSCRAT
eukprot:1028305-Ditylum_brightwellii.AAC.1